MKVDLMKKAVADAAAACELDVKTASMVIEHVLMRLPALEFDRDYTLEQLCGKEFWDRYRHRGRRIGRFFARMVKKDQLPVYLADIRSDKHRLYRKKK
jgi:hypothetical protein